MESYEIVVAGRVTEALTAITGTELIASENGLSELLALRFDETSLRSLFDLLSGLKMRVVSVNRLVSKAA